jgi:hypothetical protein
MSAQTEAKALIQSIDSGWDESMWEEIEEQSADLGLCPADIGLLWQHMDGTDDVRSQALEMLQRIAG